jgi:hypothetical protein
MGRRVSLLAVPVSAGDWVMGVLLGLDRLTNAIAGGSPQETVSSVQGRRSSWLGRLLDKLGDHSRKAIEYAPCGTVDPHDMPPVEPTMAADWDRFLEVLAGGDMDTFPAATLAASERAAERLRAWEESGGRTRWAKRMVRDIAVGEAVSHVAL